MSGGLCTGSPMRYISKYSVLAYLICDSVRIHIARCFLLCDGIENSAPKH